ncbi:MULTISPECIES: DinB family protein [Solibacillus]|uniref:DinB family protein n=1 Tax=Solibacillus merdavium TaxID=2762218 RepID=A0ABR8XN33_9BACL|nr:DinB family protein [Solibacillus merdavium]MBD8033344.1 DinB family protein [Solibacillus merdavium]
MQREKSEIIEHHQNFLLFLQRMKTLDECLLRKPIGERKWSIIEIVGHFYPWDEFVLQHRIPYLLAGKSLPKAPSAEDFNIHSSFIARTETIEKTFEKCIRIREDLLNQLNQIPEEKWLIKLQIKDSTLTLYEYLKGLMEHDIHHINQMKFTLNKVDEE